MNWINPYRATKGVWLKGNLHTHTGEGMTVAEALGRYAELGYDFLCISDHRSLTIPERPKGNKLLLLPGFEWNSATGEHMNLISFDRALLRACTTRKDQLPLLQRLAKGGKVLTILNHPNWQEPPHYSREQLFEREPYAAGLEIYNGLIDWLAGTALATEKWDYLLSRGRMTLGFANDDAHRLEHVGQSWIMVHASARTPGAVYRALQQGRFYCSTGVSFTAIRRHRMTIEVATADADEIWAVGEWGVRLARVRGKSMRFDFAGCKSRYVRFVAYGRGTAVAWTQPFLRQAPLGEHRLSPFVADWQVSRIVGGELADAVAPDLADASRGWTAVRAMDNPDGFVYVSRLAGKQDGLVYLVARVSVPRSAEWIVSLGHDGGARLWVDGVRKIDRPARVNPAFPDRSQARVKLARGAHTIAVALDTDHGKGQGIFLRFIHPDAKLGKRRLAFPQSLAAGA